MDDFVETDDMEVRTLATAATTPAVKPEGLSAELWTARRLLSQLEQRRLRLLRYQAYYDGDHPLSFMTQTFRESFGHRFTRFASNFAGLVVDGEAERLEVQGFRFRDAKGDEDLWGIWQDNDMDGWSQVAHAEALVKESVYALIDPVVDGRPRITIEDSLDCIVVSDPRDRRKRLVGLKRWLDEDSRLVVYMYLPDAVFTYRSEKPVSNDWMDRVAGAAIGEILKPYVVDEGGTWPMVNPLAVIPLVPIVNRPTLRGVGRSEIHPVTSQQDAINYYRAAAVIAARYLAVPQRWIKNMTLEIDADTGKAKQPFKQSVQDLWVIEPPGDDEPEQKFDAEFGQFPAADLSPYIKLIEAEVWQMAAISRMPYNELLGQPSSIPQSAEAQKSSEGPLLRKVGRAEIHLGEGWEETMRVALRAMEDERADLRVAETLWAPAETRNEAVRTDSLVKQLAADIVDVEQAQIEAGYSPAAIERMAARRKEREALKVSQPAPPPPPIPAPGTVPAAPTGPRMSPVPGA